MANEKAPVFIGQEAVTKVAEQVGTQIIMGPAYTDPDLIARLGIQVISGLQFKRTDTMLIRKGGTTRRKEVGKPVENKIGFLKERTLVAKLTWNRYKDNIDNYQETPWGTDGKAGGTYPHSTLAAEAIMRSYAEDLENCLFFGDIDLESDADTEKQKLSLYDGFHTLIAKDIEDGLISEQNGNLIPCESIQAPTDAEDSTPFDNAFDWYLKWNPALRKHKGSRIIILCDVFRASYIAAGYANKFHGNVKVNYLANGNFSVPEMPNVEFAGTDAWGIGDRLAATIENNLQYGVDSLSNQSFVKTQFGSDSDAQDVIFQIQSIQGARLMNPLANAFCVSNGDIKENVISGDYSNSRLIIEFDKAKGSVEVNGEAYTEVKEFNPNSIVTIKATAKSGYKFVQWSNGKTDAQITITTTGMPTVLTPVFETQD